MGYSNSYQAKLYPFSNDSGKILSTQGNGIGLTSFTIDEERGDGWAGVVTLVVASADLSTAVTPEEVFTYVMNQGLLPGTAVSLCLEYNTEDEDRQLARVWPSMITHIETVPWNSDDTPGDRASAIKTKGAICKISISDPLRYFSDSPVWGVYKNASLKEILGSVLSSVAGDSGITTATATDTATVTASSLPTIEIGGNVRAAITSIPYAIAAGETLKEWIGAVFGRLGVRIEVLGSVDNESKPRINLMLSDNPPQVSVPISVRASEDVTNDNTLMQVVSLNFRPIREQRGAIVDSPTEGSTRRIGPSGAVEMSLYGEGINVDEARYRNLFSYERDMSAAVTVSGYMTDPRPYPGHVVNIAASSNIFTGAGSDWQVIDTHHTFSSEGYRNRVLLEQQGVAWRPLIPSLWGPVIVSGSVHEYSDERDVGKIVSRDAEGRIPVKFSANVNDPNPPTLELALVEPMAGGSHGFIPQHREGDICRVSIINPLFAEVLGFCYRENQTIGKNIHDASAGVIIHHDSISSQWKGILFRPYDQITENDSTL